MGKKAQSFAEWRLSESIREFDFYNTMLKRLILSMFKWENLPDGISSRFIEEKLYQNGLVVFYKSEGGFYMVSQATPLGFNSYEEPIAFSTYGVGENFEKKILKMKECVPIYNDFFMSGNVGNVAFFAKRLSAIEKTIDVNLEQLKTPVIVSCPESQKESVKIALKKRSNGEPCIIVDEDFERLNSFKVWDMQTKNNIPQLEETKQKIKNEALTFFGINNVNVVKRERLVSGETDENNEQILLNKNAMFQSRLQACEKINEMFQLEKPISVNINSELVERVDTMLGCD